MTSLLPPSTRGSTRAQTDKADPAQRRPLVAIATAGGAMAAGVTLLFCVGIGVIAWFLTDAGSHGSSVDGLRVGAHVWLMAHGSGVHVQGIAVTAIPLGLTFVCALCTWRVGLRVGDAVSGHGPDADAIADGERDWTVPLAAGLFLVGYAVTAVLVGSVAATAESAPDQGNVLVWAIALSLFLGAPAIAVGSGRAAVWLPVVPETVRASSAALRRILVLWLGVSTLAFLTALIIDGKTVANVMSQLHTNAGDAVVILLVSLLILPNAVAFSGAYLLGPGFTVGAGTVVTPSLVVLGPLPLFPMLAALPDDGPTPGWTPWLIAVPVLVAALATAMAQRVNPTSRWDEALTRAAIAGVAAGVGFGLLAGFAGGAVGPGRMRNVGPGGFDVLIHAVTAFGVGALLGAVVMTWWQRRALRPADGIEPLNP